MCFEWVMRASSAQSARRQRHGRPWGVRCFALLLALLVVRVLPPMLAAGQAATASAPRISGKQSPRVETNALRVTVAVRVAPAPLLARVPSWPAPLAAYRWPSARLSSVARAGQLRQPVTHFHSKRRIPRMNEDEPPRA
jgi:hypothetical protein